MASSAQNMDRSKLSEFLRRIGARSHKMGFPVAWYISDVGFIRVENTGGGRFKVSRHEDCRCE